MAEVRKFKPGSNLIAEAIAKAIGEGVRPTTPGAPPEPSRKPAAGAASPTVSATSFLSYEGFTVVAPTPQADGETDPEA